MTQAARNIEFAGRNGYRVRVTRKGRAIDGGRYNTLAEAIAARNELEKLPKGKPGGEKRVEWTRTEVKYRRLGLCYLCGDCPPAQGRKACRECLDMKRLKNRLRKGVAA